MPSCPVEAHGLEKRYGAIAVVDAVDLTVEEGDIYGYLGPNGADKTTTLRMLLKMILTRSTGRGTIYAAKALAAATYGIALIAALFVASTVGSIASWGLRRRLGDFRPARRRWRLIEMIMLAPRPPRALSHRMRRAA